MASLYRPSAVVLRTAPRAGEHHAPSAPIDPTDEAAIRNARTAWKRVKNGGNFEDYAKLGRGLKVLRRIALRRLSSKAHAKRIYRNGAFNVIMAGLLAEHDLADTSPTLRWSAIWLADNYADVCSWRDGLSEAERATINFPSFVRARYLAAQKDPSRSHQRKRRIRPGDLLARAMGALRPHIPDASDEELRDAVLAIWPILRGPVPQSLVEPPRREVDRPILSAVVLPA